MITNRTVFAFVIIVLFAVSSVTLTACTGPDPYIRVEGPGTYDDAIIDISEPLKLQSFASEDDYVKFVEQTSDDGYYGGFGRGMMLADVAMESAAPMAVDTAVGGDALKSMDLDYSETNVQVAGIDEADIIKTDGNYLYILSKGTLFFVKAYPGGEAEILSQVKIDGNPQSLFIKDDALAVFGNVNSNELYEEIGVRPRSGMTFFTIYDMGDRSEPELVKTYNFEGRYDDGRMIGSDVYFVTRSYPQSRDVFPTPLIIEDGVARGMPVDDIFYVPHRYNNPEMVTAHLIDLDNINKDVESVSVAVDYLQTIYMSYDNLFLVGRQQINEWDLQQEILKELIDPLLTEADELLIEKIKKTDNDVLSQGEKEAKIMQVYNEYLYAMPSDDQEDLEDRAEELLVEKLEEIEHFEYSTIHRIGIGGNSLELDASSKVPGSVINQFALDEYDNHLRIATTINARWSWATDKRSESTNNIYVLDNDLDVVGELEGLAENERIYSTRFVGDRLYMVTFRQVDPFFVVDLSDHNKPEVLGELKIPGFSNYLHPYDENHIIGIGQDATATGRTQGLKISLFDVTDVENPKEVAKFQTDEKYARSTAQYEHKAFLFNKEKNLLVIPAYSYEYKDGYSESYNGAFVFKITEDEITLRGLIDHSKNVNENYYRYQPAVLRSLFIEDELYTLSESFLRINSLDTLEGIKNIDLNSQGANFPVY